MRVLVGKEITVQALTWAHAIYTPVLVVQGKDGRPEAYSKDSRGWRSDYDEGRLSSEEAFYQGRPLALFLKDD